MRPLAPTFEADRWLPPPEVVDTYRISRFMKAAGIDQLQVLLQRAADEPEWFYPAALDFLGAEWLRPWSTIRDESDGAAFGHWFVGGGTNLSWLACERWTDTQRTAVVWEGDDGETRTLTHGELGAEVRRAAAGLRRLGVKAGDAVTMYLPMVPEAVVTMLAVARVGAIVAPAFSAYGVDPLAERLSLAGARVLITADGLLRRGKRSDMVSTALAAADAAPTVEHVVVVPRLGDPLPSHPKALPWSELTGGDEDGPPEAFSTETPWLLVFTSGSTGRPKGAVHTHGGMPYVLMIEMAMSADIGPGDRVTWPTDMGWLAGPQSTLGPLCLGATAVVFEGVMDYPKPDRLWQLIERHGVTQFGLAPTTARVLAAAGEHCVEPYELDTLRLILSAGEPWTLPAWQWLHRHVGRGWRPIINWSGGTEIGGCIVSGFPNDTTLAGRFSGPQIGMAADVVDDSGNSIIDQAGELVVRRSWPSMTRGFWQEPERYVNTYWKRFEGMWVHGDRAIHHADGSYEVPGRSDDVIKVAGKRLGPSELESLASEVSGVISAAAVGIAHPTKGQVPVLVVTVTEERAGDDSLPDAVADHIASRFGKPMRPAAVLVVPDLPRTRSGKIHRRAVRGWVGGEDPGDLSSVDNVESADAIVAAAAAEQWRATDA
jgi:acetyl-CoA synthetase